MHSETLTAGPEGKSKTDVGNKEVQWGYSEIQWKFLMMVEQLPNDFWNTRLFREHRLS